MSAAQWIDSRVPGGHALALRPAPRQRVHRGTGRRSARDQRDHRGRRSCAGSPADRFSPYEESDQRYHVRGGNDLIVSKLAERVGDRIATGHAPHGAGAGAATAATASSCCATARSATEIADRVILALPFHAAAWRGPARCRIPAAQDALDHRARHGSQHQAAAPVRRAVLARRVRTPRGNGEYRLRGAFQTTWEVTRAQPGRAGHPQLLLGRQHGGGGRHCRRSRRGRKPRSASCRGMRPRGAAWNRRVIRNAWDRNPWSLGSYALVKPGQYARVLRRRGRARGPRLLRRRAHVDASQGYLDGAVESGQRAAGEVLASLGLAAARPAA